MDRQVIPTLNNYVKLFQDAVFKVIQNPSKNVELKKRCEELGINFSTFKAQDSTKITWNDAGRFIAGENAAGKLGVPTIYASLMIDMNAFSVKKTTNVLLVSFDTTFNHANFTVPAKSVVVARNKDGSPITMYSDKHISIITETIWREYMLKNDREDFLMNPSQDDINVKNLWYNEMIKQRGDNDSPNNMQETTRVIVYSNLFVTIGDDKEVDMYLKAFSYGTNTRIEHFCVNDMHSVVMTDNDRARKVNVGYVEYNKSTPTVHAVRFTKTDTTFDQAKEMMKCKDESETTDVFPGKKRTTEVNNEKCEDSPKKTKLNMQGLPFILGKMQGDFRFPHASYLTMPVDLGPDVSFCIAKTKGGTTRGSGRAAKTNVEIIVGENAPPVPPLELYTTNVQVSPEEIGTLTKLNTNIDSTAVPRLRRVAVMTINVMLMTDPNGKNESINEDFAARVYGNVLDSINMLNNDIRSISGSNTFAPMQEQTNAHFDKSVEETEALIKNVETHSKMFYNPLYSSINTETIDIMNNTSNLTMSTPPKQIKDASASDDATSSLFQQDIQDIIVVKATAHADKDDEDGEVLERDKESKQTKDLYNFHTHCVNILVKFEIQNKGQGNVIVQVFYFDDVQGEEFEQYLDLKPEEKIGLKYPINGNEVKFCGWKLKDNNQKTRLTYMLTSD